MTTRSNKNKKRILRTKKRGLSKGMGRGIFTNKNTKSILKKTATNNPKKKQIIRINLEKNKTRTYHLDSEEKRGKKGSPKSVPDCDDTDGYPCKYNDTVFNNQEEYEEYMAMKKERNASTGHKSRSSHYSEMKEHFKKTGSTARKIPKEDRLHDPYTGKIYDKKSLRFGDKLLVNY
jgi:hypothetical protein